MANDFRTGELGGVTVATINPSVQCRFLKFIAKAGNSGNVWIGGPGVTIGDGVTDTTTGFPLVPGGESPWIPVTDLNETYRICDNVGDICYYMTVG